MVSISRWAICRFLAAVAIVCSGCFWAEECLASDSLAAGEITAQASTSSEYFDDAGLMFYAGSTEPDDNGVYSANFYGTNEEFASDVLAIPTEATSPDTGITYSITGFGDRFNTMSFSVTSAASVKKLTIPSSVSGGSFGLVGLNLYRFESLQSIEVEDGNQSLRSLNGMLYTADGLGLLCCPQASGVEDCIVPESVKYIGRRAFYGNTTLKSIQITSSLDGADGADYGIGYEAFKGCSSLEHVDFADDVTVLSIDSYAFQDCSALHSITLPPLMSGTRTGSYWVNYSGKAYAYAATAAERDQSFTSGYMPYWHGGWGPVHNPGLGGQAFNGCSSLESVVFRAGHELGMFSYFISSSRVFKGCSSLKSVVYEAAQPYWADPDRSMKNGTYTDYWLSSSECELPSMPDLYYAVDYYATEEAAQSDDTYASARIARVEFKRGTAVSDIAKNDIEALFSCAYDKNTYALKAKDGDLEAVDPNAAAAAAGFDADVDWCWKLGNSQHKRAGLMDSCYAYLVPSNDVSAGRLSGAKLDDLQALVYQHLGESGDFDPVRYYCDTYSNYAAVFDHDSAFFSRDCWFILDSAGAHFDDVVFSDAVGNPVTNYVITFRKCLSATVEDGVEYQDVETPTDSGLYLATFTPTDGTHTGSLDQWLLVKAHSSATSVRCDVGGDDASYTARQARYAFSQIVPIAYEAPYSVSVVKGDLTSAMIASSFAGLARAPISISEPNDGLPDGYCVTVQGREFRYATEGDSAAAMAVFAYRNFERYDRTDFGVGNDAYPWGSTALLCSAEAAYDTTAAASYAYVMKAPVFFVESDGSVGEDTLDCLGDFQSIVIAGGKDVIGADVESALVTRFGEDKVTRIASDTGDACGFSIAVARALLAGGVDPSVVSIADGRDAFDEIAALNLTGYDRGLALVSTGTADSKRIVSFLHEIRDDVDTVRLYGRDTAVMSSEAFDLETALKELVWSESDDVDGATALATGDTLALSGVQMVIAEDGTLEHAGSHYSLAEEARVGAGITYRGVSYAVPAKSLPLASLSDDLFVYNGETQKPQVMVPGLEEGTDYALSWSGSCVDAGVYTVTVLGIKDYTGVQEFTFVIAPAALPSASLSADKFTYNGLAQKPTVSLTGLVEDTDYTLSWSAGCKNAGTYNVVAKGKGNYTGTTEASYAIVKAANPMTVKAKTVSAKKAKKTTCKASKAFVVKGAQGKVSYKAVSFVSKKAKGKVAVAANGKVTVKKGLKKGTYKIKVKVTVAGNGNYLASNKTVTLRVKVK